MFKFFTLLFFTPLLLVASNSPLLRKVEFTGNTTFSDKQLQKKMTLQPPSFIEKAAFWQDPEPFSREILQRDIQTLIRFYQTEGFIDIQIESKLSIDQNRVDVLLIIHEGRAVVINTIKFNIMISDSSHFDYIQELIKQQKAALSLKAGERFRDEHLREDNLRIAEHFMENGFPLTTVEGKTELESRRVTVILTIKPGSFCRFGNISVMGNKRIISARIKSRLVFTTGDTVRQSLIKASQRRIYRLGVFQYVSLHLDFKELKNHSLPITIRVQETAKMTTKVGVGYGREDRFRAFLELKRLGFFEDVRQLHLTAKHSYLEPYHFNARWIHPAVIEDIEVSLNPFYRRQREPAFSIDRVGANLMLQKRFKTETDVYLQYAAEQDNLDINPSIRREALSKSDITLYNKSSTSLGFSRNTTDSPFAPVTGSFFALTFTLAGVGLESDFHFIRLMSDYRRYFQLSDLLVYAVRCKTGLMKSIRAEENTPIEERFYAGGSHSIRGWARSELGPKSSQGKPIGGHSLVEISQEYRIEIWKKLSGVLFVDSGNVWKKVNGFQFSSLHYTGGLGLRYQLPIGPIRIDAGYPLFEGEQPPQIHFSVGQAF